jgi:copper chaperone
MTYSYKTNINCIGCVQQVKPHLDQLEQSKEIKHWHLDLNSPDHVLTIDTNSLSSDEVTEVIASAGFRATPVVAS